MEDAVNRRDPARPSSTRRGLRAIALTCGLAALAMGSSGCVIVHYGGVTQPSLIGGEFTMSVRGCVSNGTASCLSGGTSNLFPKPAPGSSVQVLGGVLLPADSSPPSVLPKIDQSSPVATFTRSPTYEAELTRVSPPPAGLRWFGYISDPIATWVPGASYLQSFTVVRGPAPAGQPRPSLKGFTFVAGGRVVTDTLPASRPVDCTDFTVCIDSRLENTDTALHDLGLQAPTTVTAAPGTNAIIPVTARFAGTAGPEYAFALTAATTLAGAPATVNVPTLTPPSDSTTAVSVTVPVPANTAPGQYPVTVTARVGGAGTSVSTVTSLIVPAPTPGPGTGTSTAGRPVVSLRAVRGLTATIARTRGLPVRVTTDTATSATVTITQTRRVRIGRRTVLRAVQIARKNVALPAGTTTVRIRNRAFRPGATVVKITGTGFSARTSVALG